MEPKKTEKADLQKKSFLFFNIGMITALLIALLAFTYAVPDDTSGKDLGTQNAIVEEIMEVPPTEQLPPPPPKIEQPQIVEVPDNKKIEEEIEINMDAEADVNETKAEVPMAPVVEEEKEDPNTIFTVVEETAAPIGGMSAFYEYVGKKIKYPAQARRMNIEGRVFVEFVIERDGSITDVKAIKGIGAGCDEEAERILMAAPKWKPGKQRGKPVRQKMVLPIMFKLSS
jgi:periplasmic protein TonB